MTVKFLIDLAHDFCFFSLFLVFFSIFIVFYRDTANNAI